MDKFNSKIDEIESEAAAAYELWFRAKVDKALSDDRPTIPHQQVVKEMKEIITATQRASE